MHKLSLPVRKYPKDVGSQHGIQAFRNRMHEANNAAKVTCRVLQLPSSLEEMLGPPGRSVLLRYFRDTPGGEGEPGCLLLVLLGWTSASQSAVSTAEQVQLLHRLDLLCFCLNMGVESFLSWDSLLCWLKQKQSCAFLFQITLQAFSLSLLILFSGNTSEFPGVIPESDIIAENFRTGLVFPLAFFTEMSLQSANIDDLPLQKHALSFTVHL